MESMFTPVRALLSRNSFGPALLEHHQFLKDDVVQLNGSSPPGLAPGDENCPSEEVHVFPLKPGKEKPDYFARLALEEFQSKPE